MNDLISRQQAIEIVERYNKSHMVLKQQPMLGAASIVIELKELPSAQPEIIRCKDCKYWREDHTCKEHSLVSPMLANDFCSRAERRTDD